MKFLRMWFGCLVGIILTASIADGQDVPVSPRELEIGVIEARQRIRQGHLSIAYRGVYGDDNSDLREGTRTFWFDLDQSQQRMDTFSAESGTTDVSCYGCAGDAARHVVYSDRVLPGMGGAALVIQSAKVMPQRQRGDPDVRLIGIVPHSLLNLAHVSLEFLAESVERMQDASIEAVTLDGHKCWLVSGENMAPQGTGERTLIKAWFAEELGRSLVRKEVTATDAQGGVLVEAELLCVPKFHAASGTWFPAVVECRRSYPGRPEMTESLTITVHSINEPLPEETFELAGINILKPGTFVSWLEGDGHGPPPGNGPLVWNGSEIVVNYEHARKNMLPLGKAPEKTRDPMRMAIVALNVVALLAGIFYFGYVHLKKRTAPDSAR